MAGIVIYLTAVDQSMVRIDSGEMLTTHFISHNRLTKYDIGGEVVRKFRQRLVALSYLSVQAGFGSERSP